MTTSTKRVTVDEFYKLYVNEKVEPWTPKDLQIDDDREKALMHKIERFIHDFETSQFYHDFRNEIQSPPISKHIQRVLGSESKMKIVIYCIGSIERDEDVDPLLQLSLAILIKKDFDWIGDIEVFDPILSTTEIRALKSVGCSVLSNNQHGMMHALKPTMFFMPHCEVGLYNNLLQANWKPNLLSNVIILGNSFDFYIKRKWNFSSYDPRLGIWLQMGHILAAQTFTNESKMGMVSYDRTGYEVASDLRQDCESSFGILSWHFFSPPTEAWMRLMRWKTREEYGASTRVKVKLGEEGRLVLPEKKEDLATSCKPCAQKKYFYAHNNLNQNFKECFDTYQKLDQEARSSSAPMSSHYYYIPMAVILISSGVYVSTRFKHPNPFRWWPRRRG